MKTVYHIPHNPQALVQSDQSTVDVQVEHRSDSQNFVNEGFVYRMDVYKYSFVLGQFVYKHNHTKVMPDSTTVGEIVQFTADDVYSEEGAGVYLFGVWVLQKLPGQSTATAQSGGFTNWVWVTGQQETDKDLSISITDGLCSPEPCTGELDQHSFFDYDVAITNTGSTTISGAKFKVSIDRWTDLRSGYTAPPGVTCNWERFGPSNDFDCQFDGTLEPSQSLDMSFHVYTAAGADIETCAYLDYTNAISEVDEMDNYSCEGTSINLMEP